jgi:hypothetical protein
MTVNLTVNYAFRLPVPGTEIDVWGNLLNSNWTDIDVDLKAVSDIADAALPKAGGTMTGAITLPGNPGSALQAAPKQYVDAFLPPAGSITNAMLSTMATLTIKGNNTGATGAPLNLTAAQVTAMLNVAAASLKGLVPAPSAAPVATKYLAENMTFVPLPSTAGVEYDKGVYVGNTSYVQAHGLTGYPSAFDVYFQCTTIDQGYAVGDRLNANILTDGGGDAALTSSFGSTNVEVHTSGGPPKIVNKTSNVMGNLTPSNWKIIFKVYP